MPDTVLQMEQLVQTVYVTTEGHHLTDEDITWLNTQSLGLVWFRRHSSTGTGYQLWDNSPIIVKPRPSFGYLPPLVRVRVH